MLLSLRKASKVQNAILEMIKDFRFDTSVQVNEFEDYNAQIDNVRGAFFEQKSTREQLESALYEIRKSVSRVNHEAGINDMLADVAQLEKRIQFISSFTGGQARLSDAIIEGKLDKIKKAKDDYYSSRDSFSTNIFSTEEMKEFKVQANDLKRQKQKIQDTLLELNVKNNIELNSKTSSFLVEVGIL